MQHPAGLVPEDRPLSTRGANWLLPTGLESWRSLLRQNSSGMDLLLGVTACLWSRSGCLDRHIRLLGVWSRRVRKFVKQDLLSFFDSISLDVLSPWLLWCRSQRAHRTPSGRHLPRRSFSDPLTPRTSNPVGSTDLWKCSVQNAYRRHPGGKARG